MNDTILNGSPVTAGLRTRSANVSRAGSRRRRFSLSTNGHAAPCDRRLAAVLRQDQARRAEAAAQAAAGRRAVAALLLCLLGMVATAVVLQREALIQGVEVIQ